MPLLIRHSAVDGAIVLAGELDAATVQDLDAHSAFLVSNAGDALVLDVSAIVYLDSAGIGALLRLDNGLRARAARLVLRDAPPRLRRMLNYSGMGAYFALADGGPVEAAGA